MRKGLLSLVVTAGAVVGLAAASSGAGGSAPGGGDSAKTPLQKIMAKMEEQTKAIQKVTTSLARFKRSGQGKDVAAAAKELVDLSKKTRPFTEPASTLKKPQKTWDDYTDQCIKASEAMLKASKTNDFQQIRKALKDVDQSCSTCHGLFRPKSGGDDF